MTSAKNEWSLKTLMLGCESTDYREARLSERCSRSVYRFKQPGFVKGSIETFVSKELELSKLDMELSEEMTLAANDGIDRYVSNYVIRGNIRSNFYEWDTDIAQQDNQHLFTHNGVKQSQHTISAGRSTVWYLNVKPEFMHSCVCNWEETKSNMLWKKNEGDFHLSHPRSILHNPVISRLLFQLESVSFNGPSAALFFESKAIELLATQIDELSEKHELQSKADTIKKQDREKLVALNDFITVHYLEPLCLQEMAQKFMLNEFKIKNGFKKMYGKSAFQQIQQLRMQHAQLLLKSKEKTVSEISDIVGYSSIHNFSNAFLKKFGYRPGLMVN